MRVFEYINRDELTAQIAAGMVKETAHPSLPLRILNYTAKAQFTPELWNDTTDKCRGLIYCSDDEEIVSRPFVKFWNYSDPRHQETMPENFPNTVPTITRKFDGSLGILYRYDGKWSVATRGSFTSDQAKWSTGWLVSRPVFVWPDGYTPLVEIIYPENQIVVKYDFSGLVLLAGIHIDTGEEIPISELRFLAESNNLRMVDEFSKPIDECVADDIENEEGYVVSWCRPGTWPLRVKVKMETYRRLHRILTGTNPVTVWEMLRDGMDTETLKVNVPADFVAWIDAVEAQLNAAYKTIEQAACVAMLEYDGEKIIATSDERKRFALYAVTKKHLASLLFSMLDRKDYSPIIWKMIKPKATDTFKTDDDG